MSLGGGCVGGWGTLASAITLDPRGRSRFRDCNFEGAGRAAAPREGASATGHAVQLRRMRRRATVRGPRPVGRCSKETGHPASDRSNRRRRGATPFDQDQDALALSLPHVVRRPRSALCPSTHEARHDDPNLCVLLLALPRALSQPELCPQLRAWLPFRVWGHPRKGKGRRAKASRSAPLCFVAGSARARNREKNSDWL